MLLYPIIRHLFIVSLLLGAAKTYADNPVIGQIDGVWSDFSTSPAHHASGWACAGGLPQSIEVHLYAGGPAGVGQFVLATNANRASDQAVADACWSTGSAYRFDIPLDALLPQYFGQPIYVHGISPNGGSNNLITNSGRFSFPDGITVAVFGDPMRIKTNSTLGGAIGSLTWRGKEFVDRSDHGREFQTAAKFNDYGECFNPTEAGGLYDGPGSSPSTSQVFSYSILAPNKFSTGNFPAFWLHYVPDDTTYCTNNGPGNNGGSQNPVSTFADHKTVTVNYLRENIIKIDTELGLPYAVSSAQIESFQGSMNSQDFPRVLLYDFASRTASEAQTDTWVDKPVILASQDGNYALGVYNPKLNPPANYLVCDAQECHYTVGHYGWSKSVQYNVNSWAAVFDFPATTGPETKRFTNYVVIGTLDDVLNSMSVLQDASLPSP